MRTRFLLAVCAVATLAAVGAVVAKATTATLEPPGPPATTTSYTLDDIYHHLLTGEPRTASAFTEPSAGPGVGTMHTLDEIYARLPVRDDATGAVPSDVTSGKKFWGLTNGQWGLKTGSASVSASTLALVPRTGQTTSYAAGDDGALKAGVVWPVPRFTDSNNGTVTDNLTGLVWLKDANCYGVKYWSDAVAAPRSLASGACGLSDGSAAGDWRLPNVREFLSIIDWGHVSPALPANPFTNVQNTTYWTSTTHPNDPSQAWAMELPYGKYSQTPKSTNSHYVWPVRNAP